MSEPALQLKEPAAGGIIERLRQVFGVEMDAELALRHSGFKSACSSGYGDKRNPHKTHGEVRC